MAYRIKYNELKRYKYIILSYKVLSGKIVTTINKQEKINKKNLIEIKNDITYDDIENIGSLKVIYYIHNNEIKRSIFKKHSFNIYKKEVDKITNKNKKLLFYLWDGYDYYTGSFLKNIKNPNSKYYPTVDHKISAYYGFHNNIPTYKIGSIKNLCITSKKINSQKGILTEHQFFNKCQ